MGTGASLRLFWRRPLSTQWTCQQCRKFQGGVSLLSGHNRWSKIKHDKGKNDAAKSKQRSFLAKEIIQASKLYGPDPTFNPQLATAINNAKSAGFAKASIESAVARGQGRNSSGQALENLTVEAMLPSTVAAVIECQTDNKLRVLQDLRSIISRHGGSVTPTSYLFERKGRVIFEKVEGRGVEDFLDHAIEAGATEVEMDEEGCLVVDTEPSDTVTVSQKLGELAGLRVKSSEIIWDANKDTLVEVDSETRAQQLQDLVNQIQEEPSVQDVYLNAS